MDVSDAHPMYFISITSVKSWWSWWRCSDNCDHHHPPLIIIMKNAIKYFLLNCHDIIIVIDVPDVNLMCYISITSVKSWWSCWRCSDNCYHHHHHSLMIIVRYCDSLYILVLPVGRETGCVLSSNRDAQGSSPT
jgi:hypothetical protein